MSEGISEKLIKQVVASTVGQCAICQQPYDEGSVSVLGHQEDLWFFSLMCASCRSRGLVAALVKEPVQLATTDLLPGELDRFRDAPAIAASDVSEVHRFLSGFDGDFKALFGG